MQYYSAKDVSLVKLPSSVVETYIPLWMADGTSYTVAGTSASTLGIFFLQDSGAPASSTGSPSKLFTLSSIWPTTQKFALEATMSASNSGFTGTVALWDLTTNTQVAASQISTSSTTYTVVRSGQITLIAGHIYGVTLCAFNTSGGVGISDASVIVFG